MIEEGKVTKPIISRTIRILFRWKDISEIYGIKDKLQKAEGMIADVEMLLNGAAIFAEGQPTKLKQTSCVKQKPSKWAPIPTPPSANLTANKIYRFFSGKCQGARRPGDAERP